MRQLVRNTKIVVVHHSEDKKYKSRVKKIKIVGNIIYLFFQKLFFTFLPFRGPGTASKACTSPCSAFSLARCIFWIRITELLQLSSFSKGMEGCETLFNDLGILFSNLETRGGLAVWIWKL